MIRAAGTALVIVLAILILIAEVERRDEITVANEARAIQAERRAYADSVLGIEHPTRLAAK